jgi:hypothetical protein
MYKIGIILFNLVPYIALHIGGMASWYAASGSMVTHFSRPLVARTVRGWRFRLSLSSWLISPLARHLVPAMPLGLENVVPRRGLTPSRHLAPGHGPDNQQRLDAQRDRVGQWRVRRFMG